MAGLDADVTFGDDGSLLADDNFLPERALTTVDTAHKIAVSDSVCGLFYFPQML